MTTLLKHVAEREGSALLPKLLPASLFSGVWLLGITQLTVLAEVESHVGHGATAHNIHR